MPSWIRNSMIVVVKAGRSPSTPPDRAPADCPAIPISPVESYRHLIYWITIIEYNLKAEPARRVPETYLAGLRASSDDCFQDRRCRRRQAAPPAAQRERRRT